MAMRSQKMNLVPEDLAVKNGRIYDQSEGCHEV
jgi:hypothetical protein